MLRFLSNSELEIMELFWNKNTELSIYDIQKELPEKNWTANSIGVLLKRMEEKGTVKFDKKQKKLSYYKMIITKQTYKRMEAKRFLNDKFGGSLQDFLNTLTVDLINLSPEDIKVLDDLINNDEEE